MRSKKWMFFTGMLLFAVGLLRFPAAAVSGVVRGLRMCGGALIPALFPYFVLTRLVICYASFGRMGRLAEKPMRFLFGVEGNCFPALLLSFLGGYPTGAGSVVSLYENGRISKESAQRALAFCNNSGPAFFLGVAGGIVLKSQRAGFVLYLIHCLSAVTAGVLLAAPPAPHITVRKQPPQESVPFSRAFLDAIGGSCAALLQIGSLVLFFSVLTELLDSSGVFALLSAFPAARGFLCGVLELSSGILQLSGSWNTRFLLCAFLLGWGGVCVHFQAASLWTPAGLRPRGYLPEKALHGILSVYFATAYLHFSLFSLVAALMLPAAVLLFAYIRKKRTGNLLRAVI